MAFSYILCARHVNIRKSGMTSSSRPLIVAAAAAAHSGLPRTPTADFKWSTGQRGSLAYGLLVPTASVSAFCRPDNVELQVVAAVLAASTAVFKVVNAAVKDGLQRTSAQGNSTYIPICIN
jgi:hypothetical protein